MPATVPTPSININPANGLLSAASSLGQNTTSLRRQSLALSLNNSFHSAQLRRASFFAPFPYSHSPQFSDLGNNNALLDSYSSSPRIGGDVYERDLETAYCKNFSCCGLTLGDLHALLQHYEEAHVRFEEDENDHDDDDMIIAGFTDDDGWSTHSDDSAPSSPQMQHASRYGSNNYNNYNNNTHGSNHTFSPAASAAAAATVAALTAAGAKNTHLFGANKKKAAGVSLSDIYSEDSAYSSNPDEAVSAFPNSILRAATAISCTNTPTPLHTHTQANTASMATAVASAGKKRDLAAFSSSFDVQSPLSKKTAAGKSTAAAALTVASLMGDLQHQDLSKHTTETLNSTSASTLLSLTASDDLMSTVTGYLEQAVQRGLMPSCGEVGSPSYLLAVEELLRKRDEIVSMMESIGKPGANGADKPYRCTVNGCDKAYKNPNGLKYHNQHGHCSVAGSTEDEKANAKPYRCTFLDCGKCYKNLNGLKYHIEHSHPNLAAALYANLPGFANLEGANASQAAITAAAAIAAVKGDSVMMSAINAIIASAANNNGNRPASSSEHTPDSSPNASPVLGPVTYRAPENPFSTDVTPMPSPLIARATLPLQTLSIQTTIGGTKDTPLRLAGLMTPSSLSPTSATAPKSPLNGSQVSTLTAALAAVAVEQRRLQLELQQQQQQ